MEENVTSPPPPPPPPCPQVRPSTHPPGGNINAMDELREKYGFRVPNEQERLNAIDIGSLLEEHDSERRKLLYPDEKFFKPIPRPGPIDWLTHHGRSESKQTFLQYKENIRHRVPLTQTQLYLIPMGTWDDSRSPSLHVLEQYASAFFSMKTTLLSSMDVIRKEKEFITFKWQQQEFKIKSRMNGNSLQLLTKHILQALMKIKSGINDAFCVTAITMYDLYPNEKWNFVFGQAHLDKSVGVFSFIRYNPSYYSLHAATQLPQFTISDKEMSEEEKKTFLISCCKVMVHEMGHMFGIEHCCYFSCVMNGSNHLDESLSRPLFLCPMDLRKLQFIVQFNEKSRYDALLLFYGTYKDTFIEQYNWLFERLKFIA